MSWKNASSHLSSAFAGSFAAVHVPLQGDQLSTLLKKDQTNFWIDISKPSLNKGRVFYIPQNIWSCYQLRNALVNYCQHDESGYNDIDGKSRHAQVFELLYNFLLGVWMVGKDTRLTQSSKSVSVLNIMKCCFQPLLFALVNPSGHSPLVELWKELWVISFECIDHPMGQPIVNFGCSVNVDPKKWMVPVGMLVVLLFGTSTPSASLLFPA